MTQSGIVFGNVNDALNGSRLSFLYEDVRAHVRGRGLVGVVCQVSSKIVFTIKCLCIVGV